ncbi:hypothetical protein DPEC_G00182290 [Dallia pectoralis]|uniref:Uncharacterized protein n=1 Tax=Dallia pectoralis TaxID=75939 RepID=A0ACC2GAX3_DALPE|nr:hypothetical protein DPEC_G00182290 [Dallia pectoralis]
MLGFPKPAPPPRASTTFTPATPPTSTHSPRAATGSPDTCGGGAAHSCGAARLFPSLVRSPEPWVCPASSTSPPTSHLLLPQPQWPVAGLVE